MFVYGEQFVRLRGTPIVSPYSGEATDLSWATPQAVSVYGGFAPTGSTEPVEAARSAVLTTPTAYLPFGTDITAADRLMARGRTYEVIGEPAEWRNPLTGWAAGVVVSLREVDG